ncbi:hypothetical protein ANCCEY_13388 [Ancylostoma ceylanicum]|uniref:Thioredoxin domain-containing protein n=1 Tax=Ancylostoma ceylanicum TaxID=53326 RepID=A0A0D6L734_9BILA|nr:hypothetical protein ANCCEY_13388 [Ancylostoma ceylanicum]
MQDKGRAKVERILRSTYTSRWSLPKCHEIIDPRSAPVFIVLGVIFVPFARHFAEFSGISGHFERDSTASAHSRSRIHCDQSVASHGRSSLPSIDRPQLTVWLSYDVTDPTITLMELFVGKPLLGPDGAECDAKSALEGKMIALYFSAMWCPSCRQFTPKLGEYLTEHCGGWLAIPFGDGRIQEFLAKYEVPTIPALKVLKDDGSILVADARNQVQEKGRDDPVKLFEEWQALLSK